MIVKFTFGFFNPQVCFEPFGVWSLSAARKVFHLNRSTRASLKELKSNRLVGLAIALRPEGSLYGVLLATGTPGGLYSNVYYRRFRGRSFHEEISFWEMLLLESSRLCYLNSFLVKGRFFYLKSAVQGLLVCAASLFIDKTFFISSKKMMEVFSPIWLR